MSSSRRAFLAELSALAALGLPRTALGRPAAVVEAQPTVFYGNPDGATTLVRFHVSGVEAPAGRLRVFDRRNRLVGTAGVIRRGSRLYGELWLPLDGETRIRSELESPGVRGVFRTAHVLRPERRWTIHWVTVVDPARTMEALARLDPYGLAVRRVMLSAGRVMGNPLSVAHGSDLLSTRALLQVAEPAGALERRYGVPASSVAVLDPSEPLPATVVLALAGSGVRYAVERRNDGTPIRWLEGPGGSRLLVAAVPTNGESRALGFGEATAEMARRVEEWLTTTPLLQAPGASGSEGAAFVVDRQPAPGVGQLVTAVEEWNRAFAFPRIAIGAGEELESLFAESRAPSVPVERAVPGTRSALPDRPVIDEVARQREAERDRHAGELTGVLATAVFGTPSGAADAATALARIGGEIDTAFPGTLVFNPAPFVRTDVVAAPDGRLRVATSLPPLGYAFLIDAPVPPDTSAAPTGLRLTCAAGRLEIGQRSGAIVSLVDPDGVERVRPDSDGLNAVPGAILERSTTERLAGVGVRIRLQRWSPEYGEVHSTLTVYDALPWIDIHNTAAALGARALEYHFGADVPNGTALWEIPAGAESAVPPRRHIAHGRWLCLQSDGGSVLLHTADAAVASILGDGTVVSFAPGAQARYRLQFSPEPQNVATCTRFAWGAEPLVAVPATGSPSGRLPRYGGLLVVDQPGIAIVGIRASEGSGGVVAYVQELLGAERFVSIGAGLLGFREATLVDYLDRPRGEPLDIGAGGTAFPIAAWGISAVRLTGLELRDG